MRRTQHIFYYVVEVCVAMLLALFMGIIVPIIISKIQAERDIGGKSSSVEALTQATLQPTFNRELGNGILDLT